MWGEAFLGFELSGEQAVVLHLALPLEQSPFRTVLGDACFLCILMKEGVSKKKEILTTGRVLVEARALARASGWCCQCRSPPPASAFLSGEGAVLHACTSSCTSRTLSLGGGWGCCWQGARRYSRPTERLASHSSHSKDSREWGDASERAV